MDLRHPRKAFIRPNLRRGMAHLREIDPDIMVIMKEGASFAQFMEPGVDMFERSWDEGDSVKL
jgi:hypothetical protein